MDYQQVQYDVIQHSQQAQYDVLTLTSLLQALHYVALHRLLWTLGQPLYLT
jgi:hypothetical protein